MTETLAALTTVILFAAAVRLTWLALLDQRITARTLIGLPRRPTPRIVREAARLARRAPAPDEHAEHPGWGGAA